MPPETDLHGTEVQEAFMLFPSPLALASPERGVLRTNEAWRRRFQVVDLLPGWSEQAAATPNGACRIQLRAPGQGAPLVVRARVVRVSGCAMLVVDDGPEDPARASLIESMKERVQELERLAATDHLTGAWNRAHFDRTIAAELARSRAARQALSLVLFDIDHFKRVNDTHGHATGDAVLQELVDLARSRIRASDMLFRWGGEEFAVLVASSGYRGAERIAQHLRQTVSQHRFPTVGSVTVSAGVAEHCGEEPVTDWFQRLDTALYSAKAAGRDRVVVDRRGSSDLWVARAGKSALHLVWQEAYECGDATIDDEHRELFELANRLIDSSLDSSTASPAVLAALDAVIAHVARHFADEEAILERNRYDHLQAHRNAHAGLVHRALALREKVAVGNGHVGDLVEFLAQDVVARHMLTLDMAFFPLFRGGAAASGGA